MTNRTSLRDRVEGAVAAVTNVLIEEGYLARPMPEGLQRGYFLLWRDHGDLYEIAEVFPLGARLREEMKCRAA